MLGTFLQWTRVVGASERMIVSWLSLQRPEIKAQCIFDDDKYNCHSARRFEPCGGPPPSLGPFLLCNRVIGGVRCIMQKSRIVIAITKCMLFPIAYRVEAQ
jgi:hypothetical protein